MLLEENSCRNGWLHPEALSSSEAGEGSGRGDRKRTGPHGFVGQYVTRDRILSHHHLHQNKANGKASG